MEKKLLCYSKQEFDDICELNKWDDNNIPQETAFISICGTLECQKYYLEELEPHWFKNNHPEVLNLNFDDISEDSIEWHGHIFYGLDMDQARQCVKFIHENLGKNFYIHCHAGMSRSQGVVRFILDSFPEYDYKTREDNPCNTPNIDVVCKLKRIERYEY